MKWCEGCGAHYPTDHYDDEGDHRVGPEWGSLGYYLACVELVESVSASDRGTGEQVASARTLVAARKAALQAELAPILAAHAAAEAEQLAKEQAPYHGTVTALDPQGLPMGPPMPVAFGEDLRQIGSLHFAGLQGTVVALLVEVPGMSPRRVELPQSVYPIPGGLLGIGGIEWNAS